MSAGFDKILLEEMASEDHQEALADDFDVLDLIYDPETNEAFPSIFSQELKCEEDNYRR